MIVKSEELDEFATEDAPPPSEGAMPALPVSLEGVVARHVSIHWDEAVAVIEQLCDVLVSSSGHELPVPGLGDILIAENGSVALRHPGRGEKGPSVAGRALHALLADADVPVALRLFVSQSTASETHGSLREFAAGLAYFGKPGRADLIQAVYQRYLGTVTDKVGPAAQHASRPSTPRPHEPAGAAERPTSKKRRLPKWLVASAASICLLGAGVWIWSGGAWSGSGVQSGVAVLSQTGDAIVDIGARVRGALGTGGEAPAAVGPTAPGPAERVPRRAVSSAGQLSLTNPTPSEPLESRKVSIPSEWRSLVAASAAQTLVQLPSPVGDVPEEDEASQLVYSSEHEDVQPPALLYPQLPPPLMIADSRAGPLNRMELVVSADGTVERVRLVNGPTRMPDMMLLSGAKLWKFTPAFKDGEPVRYRTILTWSGFP